MSAATQPSRIARAALAGGRAPLVVHVFPTFAVGGAQVRFTALANHFGGEFRHLVVALDGDVGCRQRLDPELDVAFPSVEAPKNAMLADYLGKAIKDTLGLKRVRGDTFGYLQRSFAGCVSDVDQQEARAAGEKALQFSLAEDRDGSVTIHRSGDYAVEYRLSPLTEI